MPKMLPAIPLISWTTFPSSQSARGYAIFTTFPSISNAVAWSAFIRGGMVKSVVQVPVELSEAIRPAASSAADPCSRLEIEEAYEFVLCRLVIQVDKFLVPID